MRPSMSIGSIMGWTFVFSKRWPHQVYLDLFCCKITETEGVLVTELKREILKKATIYKEQDKEKKN